jgi:hypothetical protein
LRTRIGRDFHQNSETPGGRHPRSGRAGGQQPPRSRVTNGAHGVAVSRRAVALSTRHRAAEPCSTSRFRPRLATNCLAYLRRAAVFRRLLAQPRPGGKCPGPGSKGNSRSQVRGWCRHRLESLWPPGSQFW